MFLLFSAFSVHAAASQKEGWNVLIVYHQVVFSEEREGRLLKLQPLCESTHRQEEVGPATRYKQTAACISVSPS